MVGNIILISEVMSALAKMKRNKVAETNKIVIRMLTGFEDFGTDEITEVINEIFCDTMIRTPPDRSGWCLILS